jgi:hypothetical protein
MVVALAHHGVHALFRSYMTVTWREASEFPSKRMEALPQIPGAVSSLVKRRPLNGIVLR